MDELREKIPVKEKKSKHRLGILFLAPLAVAFVALFVLSLQWKDSLKLQRVLVEGARLLSAKDIVALANIEPQEQMYTIDLFTIQDRLLKQPMIKTANVNRELPSTIRITVVEREPIASLSESQLRCVDVDGVLLPRLFSTADFDLPLVSGVKGLDGIQLGHAVEQNDVFQAIEVLKIAQTIGFSHAISEINLNNGGDIVLYSTEGGIPITIGRGNFDKKLVMLQTFWNNFIKTGDAERLKSVDVRFDGQVVVKWNQPAESQSKKTAAIM